MHQTPKRWHAAKRPQKSSHQLALPQAPCPGWHQVHRRDSLAKASTGKLALGYRRPTSTKQSSSAALAWTWHGRSFCYSTRWLVNSRVKRFQSARVHHFSLVAECVPNWRLSQYTHVSQNLGVYQACQTYTAARLDTLLLLGNFLFFWGRFLLLMFLMLFILLLFLLLLLLHLHLLFLALAFFLTGLCLSCPFLFLFLFVFLTGLLCLCRRLRLRLRRLWWLYCPLCVQQHITAHIAQQMPKHV